MGPGKGNQKDLENGPFGGPVGDLGLPDAALRPFRGDLKNRRFFGRVPGLTLAPKWLQNGVTGM